MGYLLKKKYEVFTTFTHVLRMIKTQYNTIVCHLCSDNGCEYVSDEFRSELAKIGYSATIYLYLHPEQNGVMERKNHSLISIVRCILRGMNVPKYFCHMVVHTTAFLLNCTLRRSLQVKTPLYQLHPDSTLFFILPRMFGCTCFVQNCIPTRTKLDDKAV